LALIPTPVVAVYAAPIVAKIGPRVDRFWLPWIAVGLSLVAVYLLIAPLVLPLILRRSTAAFDRSTEKHILLLMGVGGAAAASMLPVVFLALGGDAAGLVPPWAAVCFIVGLLWCWRCRRLLL